MHTTKTARLTSRCFPSFQLDTANRYETPNEYLCECSCWPCRATTASSIAEQDVSAIPCQRATPYHCLSYCSVPFYIQTKNPAFAELFADIHLVVLRTATLTICIVAHLEKIASPGTVGFTYMIGSPASIFLMSPSAWAFASGNTSPSSVKTCTASSMRPAW